MDKADILEAFRLFNVAGTGTMSKAELYDILMYEGCERSIPQAAEKARELIITFDEDGDGELSQTEFISAVSKSTLADDIQTNDKYQIDLYNSRAKPHREAIGALFDKLDVSLTGKLTIEELKAAVAFYEGAEFDADQFLSWYETNHAINASQQLGAMRLDQVAAATSGINDGQLDYTEFSWYIVEAASVDPAQMEGVIEAFGDAIDYVTMKRRASRGMPDATFLPRPMSTGAAPVTAPSAPKPYVARIAAAPEPMVAAGSTPVALDGTVDDRRDETPSVEAPSAAKVHAPPPVMPSKPGNRPPLNMDRSRAKKQDKGAKESHRLSARSSARSRSSSPMGLRVPSTPKKSKKTLEGCLEGRQPSARSSTSKKGKKTLEGCLEGCQPSARSSTSKKGKKTLEGCLEGCQPSARSSTSKKGKKTPKQQHRLLPLSESIIKHGTK